MWLRTKIDCFFLSQGDFLNAGYSNVMSLIKVIVSLYYIATIEKQCCYCLHPQTQANSLIVNRPLFLAMRHKACIMNAN